MAVNKKFLEIQQIKFDFFKAQNPETGKFDVEFEIGGKNLFAHKNMLNLISDTFDSMLSDRWNKTKDGIVKITDYNFDDFYEFITFLYSGQCKLTNQNIYALVDMAEFFMVPIFKDYCEKYLLYHQLYMKYHSDDVFKLFELSCKYDLGQSKNYVKSVILVHGSNLIKLDSFLDISKSNVKEVVDICKKRLNSKEIFLAVYKWSEKYALEKQKLSKDPMFHLNDAIKSEICYLLPHIQINRNKKMKKLRFKAMKNSTVTENLHNPVKTCFKTVKISNTIGVCFIGQISSNDFAVDYIESLKNIYAKYEYGSIYWDQKFCIPPTLSKLEKRSGVDRYLIYDSYGKLEIKFQWQSDTFYNIIAELFQTQEYIRCILSCQKLKIEICD